MVKVDNFEMPTPPKRRVVNCLVIAVVGVSVVAMLASVCGCEGVGYKCGHMACNSAQLGS